MGVAEARELPDRPSPAAVAGRVEAAGEGVLAGPLGLVGAVGRVHLDAGQGGEVVVANGCAGPDPDDSVDDGVAITGFRS